MLMIAGLAGLAIGSLHSVKAAVSESQVATENLLLAERFSSETARVLLFCRHVRYSR